MAEVLRQAEEAEARTYDAPGGGARSTRCTSSARAEVAARSSHSRIAEARRARALGADGVMAGAVGVEGQSDGDEDGMRTDRESARGALEAAMTASERLALEDCRRGRNREAEADGVSAGVEAGAGQSSDV